MGSSFAFVTAPKFDGLQIDFFSRDLSAKPGFLGSIEIMGRAIFFLQKQLRPFFFLQKAMILGNVVFLIC